MHAVVGNAGFLGLTGSGALIVGSGSSFLCIFASNAQSADYVVRITTAGDLVKSSDLNLKHNITVKKNF